MSVHCALFDLRHTLVRYFTPLEDSYDVILKKLLSNELLKISKSRSYCNPFIYVYCAYHQSTKHATSDYIELKHKVQDLIDDKIVDVGTYSASCGEDTYLEKDHVNETMSNAHLLDTISPSNIHASPKALNLPNMLPPKMSLNAFHTSYAYPQGIPLK